MRSLKELADWLRRCFRTLARKRSIAPEVLTNAPAAKSELDELLSRLVRRGWESASKKPLTLSPSDLPHCSSPQGVEHLLQILYRHAASVAPSLNVPIGSPVVRVSPLDEGKVLGQCCFRADHFEVTLAQSIFRHQSLLRYVVAHEACHHILNLSSLDLRDRERNERQTDLAVLICGFGDLMLSARLLYGSDSGSEFSQIGYLTDEEQRYASAWVRLERSRLEEAGSLATTKEVALYRTLVGCFHGDVNTLKRTVDYARRRFPQMGNEELYEWIIEDHARH